MARFITQQPQQQQERRGSQRISIEEINKTGGDAFTRAALDAKKSKDRRAWWEKVLDAIDLPRNLIAQTVADIAGVDKSKLKSGTGALGLKRVYMSDVLNKLGVKNRVVRGIAGFIGDVAIDPLTYFSAGGTAGMKVAGLKGARIAGKGQKGIRAAMKAGEASPDLLRALGMSDEAFKKLATNYGNKLSRRGGEITKILGRNATRTDSVGDAAREYLKANMLKGRPIARIPFTQKTFGRMPGLTKETKAIAPAFKAVSEVDLPYLKDIGALKKAQGFSAAAKTLKRRARAATDPKQKAALTRKADALLARAEGGKKLLSPDIQQSLAGKRTAGRAARQESMLRSAAKGMEFADDAPLLLKLAQESRLGTAKSYTQPKGFKGLLQGWKNATRRFFGADRSPLRTQTASLVQQAGPGAASAGAVVDAFEMERLAAASRSLAKQGLGKEDEIMRTIGLYIDGRKLGMSDLDEFNKIFQTEQAQKIIQSPEAKEYMRGFIQRTKAGDLAQGRHGPTQFPRVLTKESRQAVSEAKGRIAGQEFAPRPALGRPGQDLPRTKGIELRAPNGDRELMLLTKADTLEKSIQDTPKIQRMLKDGWKIASDPVDVSAAHMNKLAREGKLADLVDMARPDQFFELNPAKAAAAKTVSMERNRTFKELAKLVAKDAVVVPSDLVRQPEFAGLATPKVLRPGHPLLEVPEIARLFPKSRGVGQTGTKQVLLMPKQVAEAVDRFAEMWTPRNVGEFLKATDQTLKFFKWGALYHPSYIVRNVAQNTFGTMMAGLKPIRAWKLARGKIGKAIDEALQAKSYLKPEWIRGAGAEAITLGNRQFKLADLVDAVRKYNIELGTKTANELTFAALQGGGASMAAARGAGKAAKQGVNLIRQMNTGVEKTQRLGAFLSALELGDTVENAVMRTLTAMPDMSDLTRLERDWATRILPWYRWMRHNGALQLWHYLPDQPQWIANAGRLKHLGEALLTPESVPDDLRPDWQRDAGAMQIGGDASGGPVWLLRSWLPFEEVSTAAALVGDPKEAFRTLAGQARPGLRFIPEMGLNRDFFQQRDLEPVTVQNTPRQLLRGLLGGRTETAATSMGRIRPITETAKTARMIGEGRPGSAAMRALIGGAIQQSDAAEGLQSLGYRLREEARQVRAKINDAREAGDQETANQLTRELIEIFYEMYRRGIEGVPQSTIAMFEQMNAG
jgi:hypothetical protein